MISDPKFTATRDPKFFNELKQLNDDLFKLIEETQKISGYFDYSPTFNDYVKQFNELDKRYPDKKPTTTTQSTSMNTSLTNSTSTSIFALPPMAAPSPAPANNFNFGSALAANTVQQQPAAVGPSPPKPLFSSITPFSTGSSVTSTPATTKPQATTAPSFAPLFSSSNQPFVFGTPVSAPTTVPLATTSTTTNPTSFFSFTLPAERKNDETANTTLASSNTTTNVDATNSADADDDGPPPEPSVDKYEEPDAKFQIRCKLYERGGNNSLPLVGIGVMFVKDLQLDNYEKKQLQVVMRQDPDLRKVLLSSAVTMQTPIKCTSKAIQMMLSDKDGQTKIYVAKLKDEKDATQLYDLLTSLKNN